MQKSNNPSIPNYLEEPTESTDTLTIIYGEEEIEIDDEELTNLEERIFGTKTKNEDVTTSTKRSA